MLLRSYMVLGSGETFLADNSTVNRAAIHLQIAEQVIQFFQSKLITLGGKVGLISITINSISSIIISISNIIMFTSPSTSKSIHQIHQPVDFLRTQVSE
jgi:hypothetical protein